MTEDLDDSPCRAQVLIEAQDLSRQLAGTRRPVVLDVRWKLGDADGARHHEAGHLPGAVYVDLDSELAGPIGPRTGRHPLPEIDALQAAARRWGVRTGDAVVAYDDNAGQSAARAWWLLRWAGLADVRILDGGLAAWTAAGFDLETGPVVPAVGDVELSAGHLPVLDADAAAIVAGQGRLLDARAGERYRGEVEPVDPRPGHIPGAISAPTVDNLDAAGRFRPAEELQARFAALGVGADEPVGVYCGSGVTAAHEIVALASIGVAAQLYPGSWSAWVADPDRPVALGRD